MYHPGKKWLPVFIVLLVMSLLVPAGSAYGQEPLTVEEAIDTALKNSNDLKSIQEQVERLWEQRKDVADDVDYVPAPGVGAGTAEAQSMWTSLLNVDINWRIKKRELEEARRKLALDIISKYMDVVTAQENLKRAEIIASRDTVSLKNMQAMVAVGMATQANLSGIEAQAENAQKSLEVARHNLEKAYEALNRLMGVELSKRYEVIVPDYRKLAIQDVEVEAERAVDTNYDVWLLRRKTDIENWDLDYPFTYGPNGTAVKDYDVEEHDVYSVNFARLSAEDAVREQVRKAYRDILNLEEQIVAAQKGVAAAEENARTGKVQYEVGVITREQLLKLEAGAVEAATALNSLKAAHFASVAVFKWLTGKEISQFYNNNQ
ncbi:Outer membrane efflux protein [Moorella glycerini]|uniref:Outer membrane efflux protein n=1 Tax=Neomoorella stamsii TaxID=1266720 RepID=A0A9X7J1D9_9FIRM|nr:MULTISPECIES: TolC family protein [Moorella]PRR69984.1 Outer membrane efflux protein [Moorella stamsii]CEP68465.1 Outer membrane efflux protein [Moorella glycerini]